MEQKKNEEKAAIIPYVIIQSIAALDNIYEARLFGWVLAKAQSVLKLYNKDLAEINLQHAMNLVRVTIPARYLLKYGDRNYKEVEKAFGLATKKIELERDGRHYHLNIIAFPEWKKEGREVMVTFVIHNELWHAMLDFTSGYRLVSLQTYLNLSSIYSIVLYILVSQQSRPMTYQIMTLRRLMGIEALASYDRGNNFFTRILDPARKELNEKSPFSFEYSAARTGRGGKYEAVTIIPIATGNGQQESHSGLEAKLQEARLRLDDRVTDYLKTAFGMQGQELEVVERYLPEESPLAQIDRLSIIRQAALKAKARRPKGYLINALKSTLK